MSPFQIRQRLSPDVSGFVPPPPQPPPPLETYAYIGHYLLPRHGRIPARLTSTQTLARLARHLVSVAQRAAHPSWKQTRAKRCEGGVVDS